MPSYFILKILQIISQQSLKAISHISFGLPS